MSTIDRRRFRFEDHAFSRRTLVGGLTSSAIGLALSGCGGESREVLPTRIVQSGSPVALVSEFADPKRWEGRILRIAAWGGEVQSALRISCWNAFATATGCRIQEVSTDYELLVSSVDGGQPYADVLIVDEFWAETVDGKEVVETISNDDIERDRFGVIAPSQTAVPAYAYALVSAFQRQVTEVEGGPRDWQDWWDLNKYDGGRCLPRTAFGSLEFALLADGVERDDLYPLDVPRAVANLSRISERVKDFWWDDGLQPVTWLFSDRLDLAVAWHHRVVAGQLDGRSIDFEWNQGLVVADQWVIARGSPNRDVAIDFLRYASSPEVQAALTVSIPLGPVVPGAFDLIGPRTARYLPTAPTAIDRLIRPDRGWWAANRDNAETQFACVLPDSQCTVSQSIGTASR